VAQGTLPLNQVEVIFSGGDVPGEGEHKIMDWLRQWKGSKEFDINESHCVYGNDSDLIFLSLALHLPKIIILREVQVFDDVKCNSATKRHPKAEDMEIIFINILREYLELEYAIDRKRYTHEFDIERIIDDFILIAFFIGNDFLHKLYCMNTKQGNFDEIIEIFKSTLIEIGGYITFKGTINWNRFLLLLKKIVKLENKMIHTTLKEMESFLRDMKKNDKTHIIEEEEPRGRRGQKKDDYGIPDEFAEEEAEYEPAPKNPKKKAEDEEEADEAEYDLEDADEDQEKKEYIEEEGKRFNQTEKEDYGLKKNEKNYEIEHQIYYKKIKSEVGFIEELLHVFESNDSQAIAKKKSEFYKKFFGLSSIDGLIHICMEYIKGIEFVIQYYFHGCPSWNWYFPYFMSPFMSDLILVLTNNIQDINPKFEDSNPYEPFQQLAYILPKVSLGLMPKVYETTLLNDPRTVNFYKDNLDIFEPFDSIRDYQWIARLDIINDKDMWDALKAIDTSQLTEEEKQRNRLGRNILYKYDKNAPLLKVKSMISGIEDFEETISVKEFDILRRYTPDPDEPSYTFPGMVQGSFPTLFLNPNIEATLSGVNRRAKYKRINISFHPSIGITERRPKDKYEDIFVYYDYPFNKIGRITAMIDDQGLKPYKMASSYLEEMLYGGGKNRYYDNYKELENECTQTLFTEKAVDYIVRGFREVYYEVKYRKSAWRTVTNPDKKLLFEYSGEGEIIPHGLLVPMDTSQPLSTLMKFPFSENDLFKLDSHFVNLKSGDLMKIDAVTTKDTNNVSGVTVKKNCFGTKEIVPAVELLEDKWILINDSFMKELGLYAEDTLILFTILDSFIIRTDRKKTSVLVLGEYFDIGLRFFKLLNTSENRFQIVTDLVKLERVKHFGKTSYIVRKRGYNGGDQQIAYDVYVSPQGKQVILDYFNKFPEVINYMKYNVEQWEKKGTPKSHDVPIS
jgi:hypothetical protein